MWMRRPTLETVGSSGGSASRDVARGGDAGCRPGGANCAGVDVQTCVVGALLR